MKYTPQNIPTNKDERSRLNRDIAKTIDILDNEFIFSNFTGLGGLHGLNYAQYDSFTDYTAAKKVLELGQFFTPPDLCRDIIRTLRPHPDETMADLTCGSGNFFNYHTEQNCYGCELETTAYKVAKKLYPLACIDQGDFTATPFPHMFDLVVGNPPFNLKTKSGQLSQYAYLKKAAQYLKPGKLLAVIVPLTFLADEYTNRCKWEELAADFDFICQSDIPPKYFDVDLDIKVMFWRRHGINPLNQRYTNDYTPFIPDEIYAQYIAPIHKDNQRNAAALRLHTIRTAASDDLAPLIQKYLYHIKAHKGLKERFYTQAQQQLLQLRTQQKPANMRADEWEKARLTPEKVAAWMKAIIKGQNDPAPVKVVKLVKCNYGFKHKAYCKTMKKQESYLSFNDAVLAGATVPHPGYNRLLQRKINAYRTQEQSYSDMQRSPDIDQFLKDFRLKDRFSAGGSLKLFSAVPDIELNDKQLTDLGLAFQKQWIFLNWQQGGGKSVAGQAWLKFIEARAKHHFIVAPSLAVQLTWEPRLTKYGFDFIMVDKWEKFSDIQPGQIILMSFDMVRILQRHLKRFIKLGGYNLALLVDESDELTNMYSSRTQSMLTCFRKAKYKILTTGTTTRNTINEVYPQLELLYNNSINMICWTKHIYRPDKDKELHTHENTGYGKPFPAYKGYNLFTYSFCPQKTTVFGVKSDTQDVYNADELKKILAKTIITRTFDDIVGKRIYEIKQHRILQNKEEHRLYEVIISEFYAIVYNYYQNTGNSRKESMLRLIRQIQLLIQSTSIPHTFKDYADRRVLPQKFYKVRDLVAEWDEKVAIGTVMVEAAREYASFLQKEFPDRRVFYIDGTKSFAARKRIIAQFQSTTNGIKVSTQASLKSSVDIETCDKVIIESCQWNLPKMAQYYFRFIRYNSKKDKQIHFITYADTIEQNLLALLMCKEKLNEFIKTGEETTQQEMFNEFGIDTGILDQIIEKSYDKDGKLQLTWGSQKIQAA